jgi:hypothetical protein
MEEKGIRHPVPGSKSQQSDVPIVSQNARYPNPETQNRSKSEHRDVIGLPKALSRQGFGRVWLAKAKRNEAGTKTSQSAE